MKSLEEMVRTTSPEEREILLAELTADIETAERDEPRRRKVLLDAGIPAEALDRFATRVVQGQGDRAVRTIIQMRLKDIRRRGKAADSARGAGREGGKDRLSG